MREKKKTRTGGCGGQSRAGVSPARVGETRRHARADALVGQAGRPPYFTARHVGKGDLHNSKKFSAENGEMVQPIYESNVKPSKDKTPNRNRNKRKCLRDLCYDSKKWLHQ